GNATDTNSNRLERSKINGSIESKWKKQNKQFTGCFQSNFQNFPTQSPICGGNDGISERLDSITFSKWRNESIKAYGNAVVPQIVFEIFKAIQKYEDLH
ncbi:MAG: DNA (cytosine-5-)-methyltransferase, partial [Saprospiraceae bacterium]|nr:DNA (cytosine-5-)-methyltransferase [Candidatus Vicinibacter affinis]